jgi:hypothetical protein
MRSKTSHTIRRIGKRFANWSVLGLFALVGAGCTDGRQPTYSAYLQSNPTIAPENQMPTNQVQYQGKDTNALQMTFNGSQLLFTGFPVGLMGISIGGNQDVPSFVFSLSEHLGIDSKSSSVLPSWGTATFASGALASIGSLVYTSGDYGMSVFSIADPAIPHEVRRYPPPDPSTLNANQDEGFVYSGIAINPSQPVIYGFRQLDYVVILRMTNGGLDVSDLKTQTYSKTGAQVCCVMGSTVFQNKVFTAFTSKLVSMDMAADGTLTNVQQYPQFQAVNVQSTANYLYVHHRANYSNPQGINNATGIYVFDRSGTQVSFLKIDPVRFAVSPDDSRIYVNMDGSAIRIYQMLIGNSAY